MENNKYWQMWKHQNPQTLLAGMLNGTGILENSLAVPQMIKQRVTI
jgi:hypothetical protein